MSGFRGQVWQCKTCTERFDAEDAYLEHLPQCVVRSRFERRQKYRAAQSRDPLMREATFGESEGWSPRDEAVWAGLTDEERLDAGLRSGKVRRVPEEHWTLPGEVKENWLRRLWGWITGKE